MLYARALTYTVRQHNPNGQEIKKLAKKLGDEKLADSPIDSEIFKQLGFIDAGAIDQPYEVQKKTGEPFSMFFIKKDGKPRTITIKVDKQPDGKYRCLEFQKDGSSSGWSTKIVSVKKSSPRETTAGLATERLRLENATADIRIGVNREGMLVFKVRKIPHSK